MIDAETIVMTISRIFTKVDEKLDKVIETLLSESDNRKVKNGSELTNNDFKAFNIIELGFRSLHWKDDDEELKRFIRGSMVDYLARIAEHKEAAV